jgi:GH15 family glucan-1,4-alpha-glucosidase
LPEICLNRFSAPLLPNTHEQEVPWLPGYEGSTPVRFGNAAASQSQVDIFGELFGVLTLAMKAGLAPVERTPKLLSAILEL